MRRRIPTLALAAFSPFVLACGAHLDVTESSPADTPDALIQPPDQGDAGPAPAADAATNPSATKACSETSPRATPVAVAALPEAGEAAYVDLLQTATKSIRVLGYQMGYGGVLDTLKAKATAGIDVRVILDGDTQRDVNDKYRVALEGAGAKFEWSDTAFAYMHAKIMVVDDREAIVSTGNYGRSFMLKERNFVARIADTQDVGDLAALFDADWARTSPDVTCTRLLVAPLNARDRLLALINGATKTLLIESMQFSDTAITNAVLARKQAGVDVRAILAAPSWIDANQQAGADLVAAGIPAKWMSTPGVHVKAMVADGARAYLGSENFSYTSLSKNREVGVVVSDADAVKTMGDTFEKDWATATSF